MPSITVYNNQRCDIAHERVRAARAIAYRARVVENFKIAARRAAHRARAALIRKQKCTLLCAPQINQFKFQR